MKWYLPNLRRCFTYRPNINRPCPPLQPVISDTPSRPVDQTVIEPPPQPPKTPCNRKPDSRTCLLKCDSLSSIIIPDGAPDHTRYLLATLSLDNAQNSIRQVFFTFSCNIRTDQAVLYLNFYITQQGKDYFAPLPMQSNWNYSQHRSSTMTDAVTFSTCCSDLITDSCCTICLWADLLGISQGSTYITNSILTALVQEKIVKVL